MALDGKIVGKVRNDAGVREGDEISMFYDPMISKLSTWAKTREAAIDIMGRALEDFHIEGLGQNIPFLAAVMDQPRFRSGKLSTNYIKDEFPDGFTGLPPTDDQQDIICAVALSMHRTLLARAAPDQLRQDWIAVVGHDRREVRVGADGDALVIAHNGRANRLEDVGWRPGQPTFRGRLDGRAFTATVKALPSNRARKIRRPGRHSTSVRP